ncbi:IclR family transcriptional regulator [Polaromonas sp.]|uniref:IclR family transcriptional regulator n=1 Tax=Polaromonas sp. TaxID=1869339 RepID=UPI00352B09B5
MSQKLVPQVGNFVEPPKKDRDFAITLSKGLEMLRCFTPEQPALSNSELAQKMGIPKPTVSRFTYTLCMLGCLRPQTSTGKYQLGAAVVSLGYTLLATIGLRQVARPYMHQLADFVQGAVSMGIRDRLGVIYVDTCRSRSVTGTELSDIGMTHPMLGSSIGRAYLAGCSVDDRAKILNEIRVKTPEVWDNFSLSALRSIEEYEVTGFCESLGELRPTRYAVGVPLKMLIDGERIVFNCTVHSYQTSIETVRNDFGPRLRLMVEQVESHLIGVPGWNR